MKVAVESVPHASLFSSTSIMQPKSPTLYRSAAAEQAGAASDDSIAPGSVKIRDPLCSQAPGARCLRTPRQIAAAQAAKMKKARATHRQPERLITSPASYQPR
jgi:hypothetical protein